MNVMEMHDTLTSTMRRLRDTRTDRMRILTAFKSLRKSGFTARANYMCCSSCATSGLANDLTKRGKDPDTADVVYWHKQDDTAFTHGRYGYPMRTSAERQKLHTNLYIRFSGPRPQMIVDALKAEGLNVEWNGDPDVCIMVKASQKDA